MYKVALVSETGSSYKEIQLGQQVIEDEISEQIELMKQAQQSLSTELLNNTGIEFSVVIKNKVKYLNILEREIEKPLIKFAERYKAELQAGDILFFYDDSRSQYRISWFQDEFYWDYSESDEEILFQNARKTNCTNKVG